MSMTDSKGLRDILKNGGDRTPPNVRAYDEMLDRIREGLPPAETRSARLPVEDAPAGASEHEEFSAPVSEPTSDAAVARHIAADMSSARQEVVLSSDVFICTIMTGTVCVNSDSVGFFVDRRHLTFIPKFGAAFTLRIGKGDPYNVIYAGGFFALPTSPYALLSFLVVQDKPETDTTL